VLESRLQTRKDRYKIDYIEMCQRECFKSYSNSGGFKGGQVRQAPRLGSQTLHPVGILARHMLSRRLIDSRCAFDSTR
jgi:hypothetical protein